jgi:hypothetical protein
MQKQPSKLKKKKSPYPCRYDKCSIFVLMKRQQASPTSAISNITNSNRQNNSETKASSQFDIKNKAQHKFKNLGISQQPERNYQKAIPTEVNKIINDIISNRKNTPICTIKWPIDNCNPKSTILDETTTISITHQLNPNGTTVLPSTAEKKQDYSINHCTTTKI